MRAPRFALAAFTAFALAGLVTSAQAIEPVPAPASSAKPPVAKPPEAKPEPTLSPAQIAALLPNKWMGSEYVMGSPTAKVTLVEYASASCPHCARFDANVFPQIKAKYVDTGKVRYVFREFLTEPENVAAIGFLMARCAGKDKYFDVVEQVFRAQPEIYGGKGDLKAIFVRIAKANGLNEPQFDACISDKAAADALNARVDHAANVDKIDSTPTLVANGKKLAQAPGKEWDFTMVDSQLQPLLKRSKRR
ncbi:thioredoxin domain-containing protein [Caulobacter sp. S45]|jgi:protein-disulfide isomerase|uniref:thioredoxin domain-containing protein n=1 Tax=Caulobacter sp. S45 TaxID=1641861 RepID=UPI00131D3E0F|nr:thioredoxin domain-containing protein [Caulobacter sp. S45]